jgi:hypothetical protein
LLQAAHVGGERNRCEFIIVGDPLISMGNAEKLSTTGTVVISPQLLEILQESHCIDCSPSPRKLDATSPRNGNGKELHSAHTIHTDSPSHSLLNVSPLNLPLKDAHNLVHNKESTKEKEGHKRIRIPSLQLKALGSFIKDRRRDSTLRSSRRASDSDRMLEKSTSASSFASYDFDDISPLGTSRRLVFTVTPIQNAETPGFHLLKPRFAAHHK